MRRRLLIESKPSLTLGVETKTALVACGFLAFLCIFEGIYLRSGVPQALDAMKDADQISIAIGILYLLVALYILFASFLVIFASGWPTKLVGMILFALVTLLEYSYHSALGRFTDFYDIVAALSATREQQLYSVTAFFSDLAFVPIAVFALCCLLTKGYAKRFGPKQLLILVCSTALFYLHFSYVNQFFFNRQFASSSLGSFSQTLADYFVIYNPVAAVVPPKREVVEQFTAERHTPKNNIVFIFDESIRGDHLSLNGYRRETTPYLKDLADKKLLLNWGIAASASTSSHPSYDAFISGATPEMLEQVKFDGINEMPTIFQYAKAMNYRTHLFDGQMKHYWGGIDDDRTYIDNFVSLSEIDNPNRVEDYERGGRITSHDDRNNDLKQWEIDRKIARMVNDVFSNSTGNFIFIYKRGAHFPYEKNYPDESAVWKPVYYFKNQWEVPPADQRHTIVNSYDNSIRYNLDSFFKELSPDYTGLPNGTVIVYTSDHGQSFYAGGKAGHGGSTPEEANIPLFILGLKTESPDTKFKASHANVFTALLDLLNYPVDHRKYSYAPSLFSSRASDSSGRSFNLPTGKKVAFD